MSSSGAAGSPRALARVPLMSGRVKRIGVLGYAVSSPDVVLALLDLRARLGRCTIRPDVQGCLRRQEAAVLRQFRATDPDERDLARVEAARTAALAP